MLMAVTIAACSAGSPQELDPDAVIIDVRTPEEFAAGHLSGALNIDFNGEDFEAQISKLPKDGTYVLYCRSGNRAGQALTMMNGLGYASVTNAGSLQQAADATGLTIVT